MTEIGRSISGRFSSAAFIYGSAYPVIFLVNLFLMPDLTCRTSVILSVIFIVAAFATAIAVRRRGFSARAIENLTVPFCVLGGLGILGDAWGWERCGPPGTGCSPVRRRSS